MEAKKLTIEDNKKVQVVHCTQPSTFGNPNPKQSSVLYKLNPQILNPSKFTFMTIILHLITHLKMWINHVI